MRHDSQTIKKQPLNGLFDLQVYLDAVKNYKPNKLQSNHSDDCSTEAFIIAANFVGEVIREKKERGETV